MFTYKPVSVPYPGPGVTFVSFALAVESAEAYLQKGIEQLYAAATDDDDDDDDDRKGVGTPGNFIVGLPAPCLCSPYINTCQQWHYQTN